MSAVGSFERSPMRYQDFIRELQLLVVKGEEIRSQDVTHEDERFREWRHRAESLVRETKALGYRLPGEFNSDIRAYMAMYSGASDIDNLAAFRKELGDSLIQLRFLIDQFQKYGEPVYMQFVPAPSEQQTSARQETVVADTDDKTPRSHTTNARERWRRIETFYRDWRLLCTIALAALTAFVGLLRGLDPLIVIVLTLGVSAFIFLVWDAASRTNKWTAPVIVGLTAAVVLTVSISADWRRSFSQLFSANPPVSLSAVRAKDELIAQLRGQVSTLDVELRRVTFERDKALETLSKQGSQPTTTDPHLFALGSDLIQFVEGYAAPAGQELIPLLNISSGDQDLDTALDTFLPRNLKERQTILIAALQPSQFRGDVQYFCDYFAAYQETVRWFYKLANRWPSGNWYTVNNNPQRYSVWLRKDERFLQQLRVLVADPRFAGLRTCVDSVGYHELLRERKGP
jgi:hypothetical protein